MRKAWISVLAIAVLAVGVGLAVVVFSDDADDEEFPVATRERFLERCEGLLSPDADCGCLFDSVERQLSLAEYRFHEEEYLAFAGGAESSAVLEQAFTDCS